MTPSTAMPPDTSIGIEAKVAFLRSPSAYPDDPATVDVIETHLAWVFLAGAHAYKLKKPVVRPGLDFRTLGARYRDAKAEVRLNRRLAPSIYRGVVSLHVGADGRLHLLPTEETVPGHRIVDWLVWMRRLPASCMMDARLRRGAWTDADVDAVAQRLATFYRDARPAPMKPTAYVARYREDVEATFTALVKPSYGLPSSLLQRARHRCEAYLSDASAQLGARAQWIVEAHGDLRPEHICIGAPQSPDVPVVIDCLAFARRLRLLDPADELTYLILECERMGSAEIGPILFATYSDVTGDRPPPSVVDFYRTYRCSLRAKFCVWHLDDAVVDDSAHWRREAEVYLRHGLSPAAPTGTCPARDRPKDVS